MTSTNQTATFEIADRDFAGNVARTYVHVGLGADIDQPGTYAAVINSAAIEDFEVIEVERIDAFTILVTSETY